MSSLSVARGRDSALLGTPMLLLGTHPLANYGGYDPEWPPASSLYWRSQKLLVGGLVRGAYSYSYLFAVYYDPT